MRRDCRRRRGRLALSSARELYEHQRQRQSSENSSHTCHCSCADALSQREMIWLAYALGSSHQEIAEALGLRTGSVKPLLFRARRKLAALLGRAK